MRNTPGLGLGTTGSQGRGPIHSRRPSLTVPTQIDTSKTREPNESMAHKRYTTALRGTAEERNADILGLELVGIVYHAIPGRLGARLLVILKRRQEGSKGGIRLNTAPEADVEERGQRGSEVPESGVSNNLDLRAEVRT